MPHTGGAPRDTNSDFFEDALGVRTWLAQISGALKAFRFPTGLLDLKDIGTTPALPPAGWVRMSILNNVVRILDSAGTDILAAMGSTSFLGLSDTPGSYSGQKGLLVAVNGPENALEFMAAGAAPGIKSDSASETQQTSGGSGFETLKTVVLDAGILINDGDIATFRAGGRVLGTGGGSNRSVAFSFGGARFVTITIAASGSPVAWRLDVEVVRTGASAQTVFNAGTAVLTPTRGTASADLTADVTCLIEGQDQNSTDTVTCDFFYLIPRVF
ncbi:hypothetical protein LCGC14_0724330 [marine sediment metagenome]|uniref:Uncharacterized protein n=1 Tax=marine sediment metagenome TaxID=412755 RepID=A0A0F9SWT1_9ZZZZ